MTEVATLGLSVDGVSNIDRATSSLDRFAESGSEAEKSTKSVGDSSKRSSRDIKDLSNSSGDAAKKVSDLGSIAKRAAGIMAGAFAGIKLTGLITEAAMASSRFEQLEIVAARVGRNVGLSADQVGRYSREVQGMGISMTESRQTVIRMIQAQMDLSKASELARLAQDAAVIANTNSSDALGRLIYGLQSGQVEILRNMGLNVNFAASYTQLAAEMGVTVNQLSEVDKVQARTNAVMAAGAQIAGTYEASMDSASKQLGSTTRYVQDLQVMIGGLFSDAARQSVFGYSDSLKVLHARFTALTEDGSIERWSQNVATALNIVAGLTAGLASYAIAANGLTIATKAAAAAQWLLNAAMLANPYALAIAALVSLGVALYGMRNRTIELGDTTATVGDYMSATWDKLTISASGYADAVGSAFRDSMPAVVNFAEGVGSLATAVGDAWLYVMRTVANIIIGTTESVGRTVGILAESIYNAFKNAFQAVLNLGQAFRKDLVAILSGDLSFSSFRQALSDGLVDPVADTAKEIGRVWKANLSYDWLGGATQAIKDFGSAIGEAAEMSTRMRTVREELAKKALATKQLAAEVLGLGGEVSGLNDELGKLQKTLQSTIDRYDRSGARVRQLTKDHEALRKAMAMGLPGAKEAMDAYYDSMITVERRTETLALTTEESADWMATAFERGVERMRDGIGDFFERMIVDGKASFSDLTDLFKKMIAEMIATAAANRIMIGLGFAGAAGGASAGGLGGSGGVGLSDILNMKNLYNVIDSGFASVGNIVLQAGGLISRAGGYFATAASNMGMGLVAAGDAIGGAIGMTNMSAGAAAGLGGVATAGAGWAGGRVGSDLGLALTGKEGSGWGAAGGAAIGAYVGSIVPVIGTVIGSAIGGLIGGVVDSIFGSSGWNTTRGGLQLGFGDEGFDPMAWERQTKRGGLFGSTKRRYRFSELDEELDAQLHETYTTALDSVRELYEVLGVAVEDGVLEGVQIATLQIGTAGKSKQSQEAIEQQIGQWFADLQEAAVQAVDSSLNTETLTIYASSLASVNEVFGAIGLAAYDVSIEGGRLSAQLLQLAGGIENLLNATDFYYQNFYSEQERLANLTRQTTAAFEAMGLVMPGNRAEFRQLVESIDQTTEAGQALFLQLLNLAPAMHDIAGASEAAYQELLGSAQDSLRSAWGALEASVRNEQQALTAAWNDTRNSIQGNIRTVQNAMRDTERVATSLNRTLEQMRGNSLAFDPSMQFTEASDYLRSVLASGGLGDQDRLDRALAVVANPSADTYETLVDYQRDFLQTAGVVEELEARAGKQLSAQERSVTALERQLALAESQFELEMARLDGVLESQARMIEEMIGQQDWLASINAGILSIPDAIAALGASIRNAQRVQREASMTPTESTVSQAYRNLLGREADAEGFAYWTAELVSGRLPTGQLIDTMRRVAIENGEIPRFSGGGIATGPNSGYLAELHGREAVVPIPNGHIPVKIQGNDGVRQEIAKLREDLRNANRALIKSNEKMREILQMWNQTGMPEERDLQ